VSVPVPPEMKDLLDRIRAEWNARAGGDDEPPDEANYALPNEPGESR
jgi:hypothetical protein